MFCRILLVFFALILVANSTLSPKSKKKQTTEKPAVRKIVKSQNFAKGPLNETVFQRNLVNDGPIWASDVISNYRGYFRETDEYSFEGIVLGYVTPVIFILNLVFQN